MRVSGRLSGRGYRPDPKVLEFTKTRAPNRAYRLPAEAAKGADVIFTDVWASMGQEGEAEINGGLPSRAIR